MTIVLIHRISYSLPCYINLKYKIYYAMI